MRFMVIFSSILFISCFAGPSQQSSHPVKDLVQLVVMFVELTVQHVGTIVIQNRTIPLDKYNPAVLEGIVGFQKIRISGLDSLIVNRNNIDFYLNGSVFSFCANLSIPNNTSLEIVEYDADIVILSEIPLYGSGKLLLGFKDIDFALCAEINLTEQPVQLTDFLLKPSISGLQFELTGFWNNDQLSEAITKVVATLENIIMSFWSNEINCITCMLSISLKQMINDLLNPNTAGMDIYQIAEVTTSDCKDDCGSSNNHLLSTIFNTNPSDFFTSLSKRENVKKFVYSIEDYLSQHL